MSKTLSTLCVTYRGKSIPLHFESYETLLGARGAILSSGLEGVTVDEDESTRLLFATPAKAVSHVRLWTESLGAASPAPREPKSEAEEVLPTGLTHKEEVLHMLLRDKGVTLDQIMSRYGILRDSASALVSTTCSKFGYTSHRSADGVYTATKGRKDKRGEEPKAFHVLGRGRRPVTESRTSN